MGKNGHEKSNKLDFVVILKFRGEFETEITVDWFWAVCGGMCGTIAHRPGRQIKGTMGSISGQSHLMNKPDLREMHEYGLFGPKNECINVGGSEN